MSPCGRGRDQVSTSNYEILKIRDRKGSSIGSVAVIAIHDTGWLVALHSNSRFAAADLVVSMTGKGLARVLNHLHQRAVTARTTPGRKRFIGRQRGCALQEDRKLLRIFIIFSPLVLRFVGI